MLKKAPLFLFILFFSTKVLASVIIISDDFPLPELSTTRRVWLYLPPEYFSPSSQNKRYSVLYMQDGQNLFDPSTSFAGEWKVDETLDQFYKQGKEVGIVVGVDNGGVRRIDEYSPWKNSEYGGGKGDLYAQFLVNTLRPYINTHFRTKTEAQFTGIAGSSMGALISLYAGMKYSSVFGKVGAFSPSLWFSEKIYDFAHSMECEEQNTFDFVAGTFETESLQDEMIKLSQILLDQKCLVSLKFFNDGAHREWFWAREFHEFYLRQF